MSYSYHIHIDQHRINRWKYIEILDLSMNRFIDNVKNCPFFNFLFLQDGGIAYKGLH